MSPKYKVAAWSAAGGLLGLMIGAFTAREIVVPQLTDPKNPKGPSLHKAEAEVWIPTGLGVALGAFAGAALSGK
jgi:uncharacterized membrane protein YfcA